VNDVLPPPWGPLVETYGSPLYVYRLDEVRSAHADLAAALPADARVLYSLKANPHPAVVAELARRGCGAEVSSRSELLTALDAGMDPGAVLYTGPGRSAAEAETAMRAGARLFSVDSAAQYGVLRRAAARTGTEAEVLLRVNPMRATWGSGLTMTGVPSQFGIDEEELLARPEPYAQAEGCPVVGLHFYLGSNITSADALARQFGDSLEAATRVCGRLGIQPRLLDLGGGFPRAYARSDEVLDLGSIGPAVQKRLAECFPDPAHRPRLLFESGRHLVGAAGSLIARVLDVKESKGRTFAVLDSGINHLGGMSGLGRLPRIETEFVCDPPRQEGEEAVPVDVVGPLCTPLDFWARGRSARLRAGDLVVVPNVGAYGLTASLLAFLGRDCPVEVVLDGDTVAGASRLVYERRPLSSAP